jgi:hypothetical protein
MLPKRGWCCFSWLLLLLLVAQNGYSFKSCCAFIRFRPRCGGGLRPAVANTKTDWLLWM